jgi:hypothetical protein
LVVNPDIDATGSVTINAAGIVQTASNAINASSLTANVIGALSLLGANSLGSVSATAGADLDIHDVGASLQLNGLQAGSGSPVSLIASGAVSQGSGVVQGNKVSLTGDALGASSAPLQVNAPQVRLNATAGDAYVENSQASSLVGMAATGTARYSSSANIAVLGNVSANHVDLDTASNLTIGNPAGPVLVRGNSSIVLEGGNVTLIGGNAVGASAVIDSGGSVQITTAGDFVIQGGTQSGANASVLALGAVNVLVAGSLNVYGGTALNASALLDPAAGSPLNVTAGQINLQGGSGAGAFAAIVSDGCS